MTSEDILPDQISKAYIIDIIKKGKDAKKIVDLWVRANPMNRGGSWTLTEEEIKHLIEQLEDFVKLQNRHDRTIAEYADEIGEVNEDFHAANSRAEEAQSSRDLYRKTLISVLKEVAT